jgi:hypothetical protein
MPMCGVVAHTHDLRVCLLSRSGRPHGIGLPGTGLSIGQNGNVIALHKRSDALRNIVEDAFLVSLFGKDTVEYESLFFFFPARWAVDSQGRLRVYRTSGAAEALRDEIKTWVARLERRSDADSCIRLGLAL